MSLLLKNELRLRLGPQHCDAALWRAGWSDKAFARTQATGENGQALDAALDQLIADGHALPAHAHILVEDECVYTAILPATHSWRDTRIEAHNLFADMLGHSALRVQATLTPCGRRWIGVAIESAQVEAWQTSLAARGITLGSIRVALLEDLGRKPSEAELRDGLLVLARREGISVIGLEAGSVASIEWERCDVTDPDALAARVEAHHYERAAADPALPQPVLVVPLNAGQRALLHDACAERGWRIGTAIHAAAA